jgi:hypothetical protein
MKRCPTCQRTYTDAALNFCLEDGTPLISSAAPSAPPAEVFHQPAPLLNQVDMGGQPRQWSPLPPMQQRKKSSAVWWILGGLLVGGIVVGGAVIMIIALASMGSNSNNTSNRNTNVRNTNSRANRNSNANTNGANVSNANSAGTLPASMTDDFSETKWTAGNFAFGSIWYADEQYHMRSNAKTYMVMYAPTGEYNTEDATVRVTARSVDGTSPSTGYGLMIHGQKSKTGELEDYALLIYTGSEPKYEIIKHKGGEQSSVVPWTISKIIRSGTNPNQLEIRAQGVELSFYINGQYVDRITDSENFKRGRAGLYTSDTPEVAFDDLEIER